MIPVSTVHWYMADRGWTFEPGDGVVPDSVNNADYMYQVYTSALSDYSGRVTVPVLWDKKNNTIVSNESPEIIRSLILRSTTWVRSQVIIIHKVYEQKLIV